MPHRGHMPKLDPQRPSMERGRSAPSGLHVSDSDTAEEQPERCWPHFRKSLLSVKKVDEGCRVGNPGAAQGNRCRRLGLLSRRNCACPQSTDASLGTGGSLPTPTLCTLRSSARV
mmetsp:Transcript_19404/g.57545  ORF Transcript_19404/g.57545 Transcript_19404/m.57545 type:complete len:115 (-) Transcript_19404:1025-1369(-)|eukprot:366025-Chlamydomonas_euryale.AAC.11